MANKPLVLDSSGNTVEASSSPIYVGGDVYPTAACTLGNPGGFWWNAVLANYVHTPNVYLYNGGSTALLTFAGGASITLTLPNAAASMVMACMMIRQHASYTLANQATVQKLFNGSTNGRLTLPVGAYRFNALYSLSSMSGTSGNSSFSLAGTATLGSILMDVIGIDGATAQAGARTGSTAVTSTFPAPQHSSTTATTQQSNITGTFEVTVAGTVIPSITLATAAAAVVAAGSYFECWYLGPTTTTAIGAWD